MYTVSFLGLHWFDRCPIILIVVELHAVYEVTNETRKELNPINVVDSIDELVRYWINQQLPTAFSEAHKTQ